MRGIINSNPDTLQAISDKIHVALSSSTLLYTASSYGEPIPNNADEPTNYVLPIYSVMAYCEVIETALTQEEKDSIQDIPNSFWQ